MALYHCDCFFYPILHTKSNLSTSPNLSTLANPTWYALISQPPLTAGSCPYPYCQKGLQGHDRKGVAPATISSKGSLLSSVLSPSHPRLPHEQENLRRSRCNPVK